MDKLLGKKLGKGVRRDVFEHKEDSSLVIKCLINRTDNHNRLEMENWNNADEKTREFLAPCIEMSEDSVYLVQKKGEPLDESDGGYFPREDLPEGFLDKIDAGKRYKFKKRNFVYMDGKLKLCDYGEVWELLLC